MKYLQLTWGNIRKRVLVARGNGFVAGGDIVAKEFTQDGDGIFRFFAFIDKMLDAVLFQGIVVDVVAMHSENSDVEVGIILFYRGQDIDAAAVGEIDIEYEVGIASVFQFV